MICRLVTRADRESLGKEDVEHGSLELGTESRRDLSSIIHRWLGGKRGVVLVGIAKVLYCWYRGD